MDPNELVEEFSAGAVGERSIHLVEEVLSANEQASISVLEGLHEQPAGEAGLSDAGGSYEDDVFGLGNEVELGEGAKVATGDPRLLAKGKGFESPLLGKFCALYSPVEGGLLSMMPLSAQEANEEGLVGELLFVGVSELLFEDFGNAFQM